MLNKESFFWINYQNAIKILSKCYQKSVAPIIDDISKIDNNKNKEPSNVYFQKRCRKENIKKNSEKQ